MKERHVEVRFRFEELCVNANEDILFFSVGGGEVIIQNGSLLSPIGWLRVRMGIRVSTFYDFDQFESVLCKLNHVLVFSKIMTAHEWKS